MDKTQGPIGVFDSGVGGISVLRELVAVLPKEDFIYFGDSANAPYGPKALEEVQKLTLDHIDMLIQKEHAKAVVVACNTATSAAITLLREKYKNFPVIGIEPALKPAVLAKEHARVLVMATPMTIREEKFHNLMEHYKKQATIYPLSCPGLPELVEQGKVDGDEVYQVLQSMLEPYVGNVDGVVLGCTHYPFLKQAIADILGEGVTIYDGSYGTAKEVKRKLQEFQIETTRSEKGTVTIKNSKNEKALLALSKKLLLMNTL